MSAWRGEVTVEPWMVSALDLSGTRLLVFGAIWAGCAACGGEIRASVPELRASTGLGRQTVRRALAELAGDGILELAGGPGAGAGRSWRIGPAVDRLVAARGGAAR